MNSPVLGVMIRLRACIIGEPICPQKSCCRRSLSNPCHQGTAVRRDEVIDTSVVQAGSYWLRHWSPGRPAQGIPTHMCRANGRNWHVSDMPTLLSDVRCWVNSGKHLLAASISPFDPERTWTPRPATLVALI